MNEEQIKKVLDHWSDEMLDAIRERAAEEMDAHDPPRTEDERSHRIVWAVIGGMARDLQTLRAMLEDDA